MSPANLAPYNKPSRERGLTESTQLAILIPIIMTSLFALIQAGIWFHGRAVAQSAAMATAERAAILTTQHQDAVAVGTDIATDGGLRDVDVTVTDSGDLVTADVSATVPMVLPGPWQAVHASANRYQEAT